MTKIIVAHEGKQHSFRTAEAFYKNRMLYKYITTVYDKPFSGTRLLKFFLRGDAKKRCSSRRTEVLPDSIIIQFDEWKGLLLLFLSRLSFFNKIRLLYYNWLHDSFGRKVAKYAIANKVNAVIMYDSNCNKCWEILKKNAPHIKRIMDVSIANRLFMKEIFIADMKQTNDYYLKEEHQHLWNSYNLERYLKEIQDTNYFIVASWFVKKSLLFNNIQDNQIFIVPYGVNLNTFTFSENHTYSHLLNLIFVGTACYRKGIHHLLNVVSQYSSNEVQLIIVGTYYKTSDYYRRYANCDNIHYKGFVTHDTLTQLYGQADVFVFPSLAEGFAQVSLEAMSCGLPVICTDNSGFNDAVVNYQNGIVIPPSDRKALKQAIDWFIQNKDKLSAMRIKAHQTAMNYTWEHYHNNLVETVKKIMIK